MFSGPWDFIVCTFFVVLAAALVIGAYRVHGFGHPKFHPVTTENKFERGGQYYNYEQEGRVT